MNDRIFGYIVIGILVLFLILPIGYLIWKSSEPVTIRTIAFDKVHSLSFLSVQDPVRLQGVEVGVVRDITLKNDTASVKIEIKDGVKLYEDYSITIIAKGVMGDRYLSIMPGSSRKKIIPPETILRGTVNIGPDEALSYVGELQSAVHTLAVLSEKLKNGTAQKKSLVNQIRQFTADLDSILRSVVTLMSEIDTSLQNNIDSMVVMLDSTIAISRAIAGSAPSTMASLNKMLHSLDELLTQVDSLSVKADVVITKIEKPDVIIWKKYTGSLRKNLTDLHQLLQELQSDSLTLPVRLW